MKKLVFLVFVFLAPIVGFNKIESSTLSNQIVSFEKETRINRETKNILVTIYYTPVVEVRDYGVFEDLVFEIPRKGKDPVRLYLTGGKGKARVSYVKRILEREGYLVLDCDTETYHGKHTIYQDGKIVPFEQAAFKSKRLSIGDCAVDKDFYPFGTKFEFIDGKLPTAIARDVGSAIDGPNHIDYYIGVGNLDDMEKRANSMGGTKACRIIR